MTFRLWRVAALLFGSGACALVYQVAWFRELRLIFGASTAASAAVLAIFMGGLGIGGAILGKRADKSENPLRLYANLELIVALTAGATPLLVWLAQLVYLGIGGAATLGSAGATVLRLLLSILVLGPSTLAMGGTLPSAARAVERESDLGRQRVGALYGVNTFGAVVGAVAANFILLEVFGTRLTLWMACLVNALVAFLARGIARSTSEKVEEDESEAAKSAEEPVRPELRWFAPLAAGVAGFAFILMELVWYRMLAPILGGSSYTFGLILAVALVGIGIGGALYARTKAAATLSLFAITCTVEALAIAFPYALGDRLAVLSLALRPLAKLSFGASIGVWTFVACIVVLPTAIASGFQFPAIIALYGRGRGGVGRDVGNAYLANTIGSIFGSLGGGFGLLPLLTAPKAWLLVVGVLVATGALALYLELRAKAAVPARTFTAVATAAGAIACTLATGPTHVWRHSGVGAGRSDYLTGALGDANLERWRRLWLGAIRWEEDGLESTVALSQNDGFSFIVNGKSDGHAIVDATTQVMSGLIPTLLHEDPKSALVVGLGTGSTAGWLGAVPSIESVDVIELEPAIVRVAKDCAPVNQNVTSNPKVHITLGDAREVLRTKQGRYDIIFSEPSNPYRAGIASLYTVEYYEAASARLHDKGLFVQWLQAYEVDGWAVATVLTTLRHVFPSVSVWKTGRGDLLAIGTKAPGPIDVARLRKRAHEEPFVSALRSVWQTESIEGMLLGHIGNPKFVETVSVLGSINTDDHNLLEFAYARSVGGRDNHLLSTEVDTLSRRLQTNKPALTEPIDEMKLQEETFLFKLSEGEAAADDARHVGPLASIVVRAPTDPPGPLLAEWRALKRDARTYGERMVVARLAASSGDPEWPTWQAMLSDPGQKEVLHASWLLRQNKVDEAAAALERGLTNMRTNPWVPKHEMELALRLATDLGQVARPLARRMFAALDQPFAVERYRNDRIVAQLKLARAARDSTLCAHPLAELPVVPWEEAALGARAWCFEDRADPRTAEANRDLLRWAALEAQFGAGIEGPPPPKAPPRPKAVPPPEDAGSTEAGSAEAGSAEAGPIPYDSGSDDGG